MRDGIRRRVADLAMQKVQQAVFRLEGLFPEHELEAGIEARVIPQPAFDVFDGENGFAENFLVGTEFDQRPVGLLGRGAFALGYQFPFCERSLEIVAFPEGNDPEMRGKAVDRLGADAV